MPVVTIEPIAVEEYVSDVLPETFALWGNERSFETYANEFRAVATSPYARRRRFTVGLREDGRVACSCKNYDRELRWNGTSLRATGIGAVYTASRFRGRGYASAMLGAYSMPNAKRVAISHFSIPISIRYFTNGSASPRYRRDS